jgi:parallel beta-helix repeat protein
MFFLIVLSLAALPVSALDINEGGKMKTSITVGLKDADIVGLDNRALQAAMDYVAMLGGGTVKILQGTYLMKDSLHLRSNVTVIGEENTVLRKCDSHKSLLVTDGDYGEEQVTVADASGFEVGTGITVHDDNAGGFHTTVATIIASEEGNVFIIDKPLLADCMVRRNAIAKTTFPVISGYYVENIKLENLIIDGNRENSEPLNGCRGAGIFLYRANHVHIVDCVTHSYNGDGISFQQSNDIIVENCVSYNNASLGFHPGSGSQRPILRNNRGYDNGGDGLFLCWRVRHGLFEGNELKNNGQYGISIGHKDSDNILRNNIVTGNNKHGVYFRDEPKYTGGHRNLLENNQIYDNGVSGNGCGIYIDGETEDITIRGNVISDTRPEGQKTQRFGVFVGKKAARITIQDNKIEGNIEAPVKNETADVK